MRDNLAPASSTATINISTLTLLLAPAAAIAEVQPCSSLMGSQVSADGGTPLGTGNPAATVWLVICHGVQEHTATQLMPENEWGMCSENGAGVDAHDTKD